MHEHALMLLSWCGPDGPGLLLGMFLAGLAGGPLHCGPMCGPFVLGQTADRLARLPAGGMCERARLRAGLLLPYHAGRAITYAGLGGLAGGLAAAPGQGWLTALLLLLGAMLLLGQALARLGWRGRLALPSCGRLTQSVARLARRLGSGNGLLLGLVLGFLPCGLLYAALAVAAGAGGIAQGALAMGLFALGTMPALIAIGWIGQSAGRRVTGAVAAAAPWLLLFNAALLALAGLRALLA